MRRALQEGRRLKPPDAIHLSTAARNRCDEILTYDNLTGYADMVGVKISEPSCAVQRLPDVGTIPCTDVGAGHTLSSSPTRGVGTSLNFLFAAGQHLGEKRINGLVRVLLNEPAQPVHRIAAELLRGTQLRADFLGKVLDRGY
jgi:hypothetical protein